MIGVGRRFFNAECGIVGGLHEILAEKAAWGRVCGRAKIDFIGTAEDIDETGALLVRDESGVLQRVLSGDVSVRGVMGYV